MADKLKADELKKLLRYNPDTGELFWQPRPVEMFVSDHHGRTWNTRFSGKPALTYKMASGYLAGAVFGKPLLAHRAAAIILFGEIKEGFQVDHINGKRADNRASNLRVVLEKENTKNRCVSRNNTSGVMGVFWNTGRDKWQAQIKVNRENKYLGVFVEFSEAVIARKAAEIKYGFHPNHGRKAA